MICLPTKVFGTLCFLVGLSTALSLGKAVADEGANTERVVHAKINGVALEVHTMRDRVFFCIDAEKDFKISAQYGVEFKASRREAHLWNESLPKVVTGSDWYF